MPVFIEHVSCHSAVTLTDITMSKCKVQTSTLWRQWHTVCTETFRRSWKLRCLYPGVMYFLQQKVVHFTRWQGGFNAAVATDLYPFILDLWGPKIPASRFFWGGGGGLDRLVKIVPLYSIKFFWKEALTMAWPSWWEAGLNMQRQLWPYMQNSWLMLMFFLK